MTTSRVYITTGMSKRELTGTALKLIAIITMLIDHIGASILERYILINGYMADGVVYKVTWHYMLDCVLRLIGRLAFPIYIFLLVEGAIHTSNKWKYLGRISLFALISEIPFDIAFCISGSEVKRGTVLDLGYQNVFFTLAIGLLTIIIIDSLHQIKMDRLPNVLMQVFVCLSGMSLAIYLRTDYSWEGVLAIVVVYVIKTRINFNKIHTAKQAGEKEIEKKKNSIAVASCCLLLTLVNPVEITSFLDVALIGRYNGQRGSNIKLLFYAFYPVHLFVLGLVCIAAGL